MALGAACGLVGLGSVWPGVGEGCVDSATFNPASAGLQSPAVLADGRVADLLRLEEKMGGLCHPFHQHTHMDSIPPCSAFWTLSNASVQA